VRRVVIEPGAQADIRAAFEFYEERHPGLGDDFREQIRLAVQKIGEHPNSYPEIEGGVRWALAYRFPFKLFFLVDPDAVRIIAVLHGARHWDTWRETRDE
jgi:toxin ParE1/3/4